MSNNLHTQHLEETIARLEAEAQALRKEVVALRARVVVLPEIAAWAWIAKLDGEDWDAGVTLGAEQPNLQAPVEGVTYDYAPLIGLKPLARLNGKVVSEGLLRRCEQMLQFYFEYLCDELAEEGDIAMAAEARDELRALLDEGKEDGHEADT